VFFTLFSLVCCAKKAPHQVLPSHMSTNTNTSGHKRPVKHVRSRA
jgi:hypothetical protein